MNDLFQSENLVLNPELIQKLNDLYLQGKLQLTAPQAVNKIDYSLPMWNASRIMDSEVVNKLKETGSVIAYNHEKKTFEVIKIEGVNLGDGEGVYKDTKGISLQFKSIKGGKNTKVKSVGDSLVIDAEYEYNDQNLKNLIETKALKRHDHPIYATGSELKVVENEVKSKADKLHEHQDYAKKGDLMALKKGIKIPEVDLSPFAKKSDLKSFLNRSDLSGYAKDSDLNLIVKETIKLNSNVNSEFKKYAKKDHLHDEYAKDADVKLLETKIPKDFATKQDIADLDYEKANLIHGHNTRQISDLEERLSQISTVTSWGGITGTLSNQTDLQTALDAKLTANVAITGATKTKITYDADGLVTSGADATTADIADSTNKRYVTDANLIVIGNTSNTNSGDNAVNSNYSGLTQYTDELAQDAVGNSVGNGLDYDDTTGAIAVDETELLHNSLGSKQGGTTNEYYHLTSAQATVVGNTSGTNTGDNATNSQYSGLAALISPFEYVTRTMAGNPVGEYADIGYWTTSLGSHNLRVTLSLMAAGAVISKQYLISTTYNQTNGAWQIVPVNRNTGYYGYDFHLVAYQNNANLQFRIVCFRNNNAGTLPIKVRMENCGDSTDTFTSVATSGTMTVPTALVTSSTDYHMIGGGYMFTRAIPTTVGNYIEMCSLNGVNGNGATEMWVSNVDNGFVVSKKYLIPGTYNYAPNWCILAPISETGSYSGNDFAVVAIQNSTSITFRLLRTAGSTSGTAIITLSSGGDYASFFNEYSGTGSMAVPTIYHPGTSITQAKNVTYYYGSQVKPYVAKTANYTLALTDYLVNCTANSFAITLPTAVGYTGLIYVIKNSGTGVITMNTTSSQTIDGNASGVLTLALQYDSVTVMSNGANWIII